MVCSTTGSREECSLKGAEKDDMETGEAVFGSSQTPLVYPNDSLCIHTLKRLPLCLDVQTINFGYNELNIVEPRWHGGPEASSRHQCYFLDIMARL